ncbi:fap1 adhesin-like [Haliotis asinina]|uniref:fap1 adhesin-like n=1 Tax=Haliotis asinina TaxID=109174 RepID=UPI0035320573
MDRLTLPRLQKTVDAGKCLPAGDSLPSWSNLPLDAKFPMVPNPAGTLTLFTSKFGTAKYRRKSSSDFDLTDPNGMSMSSEYHPLHDPHLRSHYSVPRMRRHLVRNGFITESGMVICNLKEFNKYRQYLRRICLMELVRERKRDTLRESSSGMVIGERAATESNKLTSRFAETRRRHAEKIDAQRAKQEMMAKLKGEQMERKRREQRERHADIMRRKQYEDDRRRDTLLRNAEETERRNMMLLRKWRRRDREHAIRMEAMRRQRESELQKRNKDSWETRKRVQRERLDREAVIREQLRLATDKDIAQRNRQLARQRECQMSKLQQLKVSSRAAREERDRICGARLARRIAAAARRAQRRYRSKCNRSPFRSEWTLQQVLRRLSFPDLVSGSTESLEFMQMLNAAIDEAVERVTSQSDVDATSEGGEEELEMRKFAADLVESVVSKVKNEIYPAYLRLLETGEQASPSMMDSNDDLYDDYLYDQNDLERPDTGTDEELSFIAQHSDESSIGDSRRRSVRFSFDESIIPAPMDSLDVMGAGSGLKPVSEHMLTPVPSPLPGDPLTSEFEFDTKEPSMPTKQETGFVESLLLRLLDDLNNSRIKRDDLVKLTGYCMEILRIKHVSGKNADDVLSSPSDHVADDLVRFTLSKILDDIRSGSVSQEDLTAITQSIVKEAQSDAEAVGDISEQALDRLISRTLSSAAEEAFDEDDHISDSALEDFVTTTLSRVKNDLVSKSLSQDGVREIGSAVVSAIRGGDCRLESDLRKTLNDVLDEMEANTVVGVVMDKVVTAIVSSYHTYTSKEKPRTEMIEFVSDILTQIFVSIKAGEFSENELMQIISTRHDSKRSRKDYVQGMIDSVLYQIDSGTITEEEIQSIGNALVNTGRKLLTDKGIQFSSTESIDPMEMTSTEVAEQVVKEVMDSIQEHMDDEEFEKEALKALAASFLKVGSSTLEGISNVPTIGSSPGESYLSTMKRPSPTESSLATDVVLAAMDRINRDLTERNIPVHMLSSIACSLAPQGDVTPSIYVSEEGLHDTSSLPQHMKMTLIEITRLLSEDRVGYDDAKKIFAIILQSYLIGDPQKCSSRIQIDESDSFMIENLISLTLNKVVMCVTEDVSLLSLPLSTDTESLGVRRLSSVMSGNDLEKFIWDTLHRIGQEASVESVLSRPPTPVQFKSYGSVDSQNIESLVRQTLVQVAQDIAEGITSDTSLVDTRRGVEAAISSSSQLSSKIVGFVTSVLQELIVGLERGKVSRDCVAEFMTEICPGKDFMNMDVDLLHKDLRRVVNDVSQRRTASVYFHAIADRFSAIKSHLDRTKSVMTPELKTVGNILSSVDASLLIEFVQATLLTVLGGMHTPRQSSLQHLKPESVTSLLKNESSVIARNVVSDVIKQIQSDISRGVLTIDENARKRSSILADRLVEDLLNGIQGELDEGYLTLDDTTKLQLISKVREKPSDDITPGKRKESSEVPKETESYVLQCLQRVVSEKRRSTDDRTADDIRSSSILLEEFLYSHMQTAVESIQNMTSSAEGSKKTPTESAKCMSDSSVRGTSSLVLETLNKKIAEMIVENAIAGIKDEVVDEATQITSSTTSSKASSEDIPLDKVPSSEVAKFVLVTLNQALASDSYSQSDIDAIDSKTGFQPETSQVSDPLQSDQAAPPEDTEVKQDTLTCVNDLVAEVISQTIANIKQGKLSQMELSSLAGTLTGTRDQVDGIQDTLVTALEGVKTNIVHGVVSSNNMENVAQQIATLPLERDDGSVQKGAGRVETDTDSSIHSMVKDVVSQIVVSLSDAERIAAPCDEDTNGNQYVSSPSLTEGIAEEIQNLANLTLVGAPSSLAPTVSNARNSFRSLVQPESSDKMSISKTSMESSGNSDESQVSVDGKIIFESKDRLPKKSSGRVTNEVRKKTNKQQSKTSVSSVSSGDSHQEKIVKKSQSKDASALKSSSAELNKSRSKKVIKSSDTSLTKKSSLHSVKSRDSSKRALDKSAKATASVPAITIDTCSSTANYSSPSSTTATSSSESQEEPKTRKVTGKQGGAKDVPKVNVSEAPDPDSNGSDVSQSSSQADAMKVRSVCGSHTTQVRVRESQVDASQE